MAALALAQALALALAPTLTPALVGRAIAGRFALALALATGTTSTFARLTWNAGVIQAPHEHCAPAQLKFPTR